MKRSRFFCENCHHEVRPNARVCPNCGRFFEAVRCPACSYVGEGRDFVHGCPNCGYAGVDTSNDAGFEQVDYAPSPGRNKTTAKPPWLWPLAIGILLIVFVGLVILYFQL